jgi:hypothetical protein
MKNRNYVSQKSKKTSALIFSMLLAIVVAESAQADVCNLKKQNAVFADSKALMAKVLTEVADSNQAGGFQKVSYAPNKQNVLDHKFHNIDRTLPYFSDMNGVGILTGDEFANIPQGYGSATLIGSCYVLTNRHVVKGILSQKGLPLKLGETFNFSVGQQKNCDSKDQFSAMNQQVTLVDNGNDSEHENSIQADWAILKLQHPIKGVKPVNVDSLYTDEKQMLVRTGFPYEQVKANGNTYEFLSAQYVQSQEFTSGGSAVMSDNISREGISGGAIFYNKFSNGTAKSYLAGISVGIDQNGNGAYMPILHIKSLIKESGKLKWSKIVSQTDGDSCD